MAAGDTGNGGGASFGPEIVIQPERAAANPSQYIEGDGQVIVDIWNSLAGVSVTIDLRLLLPSGIVVPNQWVLAPTSDRTKNSATATLSEGFVLSCTARAPAGTTPGATFVRASIVRGSPASGMKSTVLLQGYVGNQNELSYPNGQIRQSNDGRGRIRSITGTTPAAGAEITETVPAGAMWRLLSVLFVFFTGAAVANRITNIVIDDGTNRFFLQNFGFVLTASKAENYCAAVGSNLIPNFDSGAAIALPMDMVMPAGFRWKTVTDSLQAADQYQGIQYVVEEWISP